MNGNCNCPVCHRGLRFKYMYAGIKVYTCDWCKTYGKACMYSKKDDQMIPLEDSDIKIGTSHSSNLSGW